MSECPQHEARRHAGSPCPYCEIEALKEHDEVHWKTRRKLLADVAHEQDMANQANVACIGLQSKLDEAQKIIARSCFCDSEDGAECQGHKRVRDERDATVMRLREIVAWFDVMHSKYVVDGTRVDLSEEWPSYWLRAVRGTLK